MDIYLSCLIGGFIALAAFGLCGAGFHHFGVHHGHGNPLHARPAGHLRHGSARQSGGRSAGNRHSDSDPIFAWLAWFSPLYLCGMVMGFGLTGLVVAPFIQGWPCLLLALLGAYLVRTFCIRPLMSGVLLWASAPAKTLDAAVLETGAAATNFDEQGYGMVRLTLDGQVVQLLGQLTPEEQAGPRVNSGETLFIRSVDPVRQRCVVCRRTPVIPGEPASAGAGEKQSRRTCPACGHEFSGALEGCPVCQLRMALDGEAESAEDAEADRAEPAPDGSRPAIQFEHYELLAGQDGQPVELGRGAMGITYKARDVMLGCPVALKVIGENCLGNDSARLRFVREARAAASVRHPNVASVFHLGRTGRNYFYAMEFVDGETVESLVRRNGPLEVRSALEITRQIGAGLSAVHKQHLVHRDIKPSNIMVSLDDASTGAVTAKIIDLGLAKAVQATGSQPGLSAAGAFVGTPEFASPEQFAGIPVDIRSDLYGLGATLWYMLSGRAPFRGTPAELMHQHLHAALPVGQLHHVPQPVVALLQTLLEKDPARRAQNPGDLLQALAAIEREAGEDRAVAVASQPSQPVLRNEVSGPTRGPQDPAGN
ncbi:MAG: serine/threonine protein kinase [Verrucomicrobia bacterium]|nr:serine/threonine protein kinase [Verrucomicrobiota bacterium]